MTPRFPRPRWGFAAEALSTVMATRWRQEFEEEATEPDSLLLSNGNCANIVESRRLYSLIVAKTWSN